LVGVESAETRPEFARARFAAVSGDIIPELPAARFFEEISGLLVLVRMLFCFFNLSGLPAEAGDTFEADIFAKIQCD